MIFEYRCREKGCDFRDVGRAYVFWSLTSIFATSNLDFNFWSADQILGLVLPSFGVVCSFGVESNCLLFPMLKDHTTTPPHHTTTPLARPTPARPSPAEPPPLPPSSPTPPHPPPGCLGSVLSITARTVRCSQPCITAVVWGPRSTKPYGTHLQSSSQHKINSCRLAVLE